MFHELSPNGNFKNEIVLFFHFIENRFFLI